MASRAHGGLGTSSGRCELVSIEGLLGWVDVLLAGYGGMGDGTRKAAADRTRKDGWFGRQHEGPHGHSTIDNRPHGDTGH